MKDYKGSFQREIVFVPAYDKSDPDPAKNYGVHGVHIWFNLIGDGQGLTFSISTNWQLPHVQAQWDKDDRFRPSSLYKPMAFGVDIHSKTPQYEGQTPRENCHITGGECYSDGSALLGDEFLQTLIAEGEEALWKRMEEQLRQWSAP